MQAAGLTETLGDAEGSYTVLAPSDAAFGLFPQADLDALAANVDAPNVVRTPSPANRRVFYTALVFDLRKSTCDCHTMLTTMLRACAFGARKCGVFGDVADNVHVCCADPWPACHPRNDQGCGPH